MAKLSKKERLFLEKALYDLYAKTNSCKCPKTTSKSIIELWDFFDVPASKKIRYNSPTETDVWVARLLALQYAVISLGVDCEKSTEQCLYSGLFETISNTIIAIIRLAEDGLDYQAMALVRNLFELYMTLIIITDSPNKREAFISAHESEDAREVWHRYFTKAKFSKMLKAFCADHPALENTSEIFQTWIDENYGELSSYAHNDYAHIICCSRSQNDSKGYSKPNFWGEYVTWQKAIYHQLFTVAFPSHLLLSYMLNTSAVDISIEYLLGNNVSAPPKEILLELQNLIIDLGTDAILSLL